jgi:V/A-type H+-transporting ATPase subunit I
VQETLACATDEFNLKQASSGMITGAGVSLIQGYCPTPRLKELQQMAPKFGWGLKVEDPKEDDDVPTLLKETKSFSAIQFLYDISHCTGYREVDTSANFLFFQHFFARIVAIQLMASSSSV